MQSRGATSLSQGICTAAHAVAVDDDQLARLDLPDEGGADHVEGRGLRRQDPAFGRLVRAQPAQAQGPEPVGVAHAEELLRVHQHEGERALDDGQHGLQAPPASSPVSGKAWANSSATTSLSEAIEPGNMPTFSRQLGGVGQVAVVTEGEAGPPTGR